jgi:hypothetical protein
MITNYTKLPITTLNFSIPRNRHEVLVAKSAISLVERSELTSMTVMKASRVAIITRGRYAGKKVCKRLSLPLSYKQSEPGFLGFFKQMDDAISDQSIGRKGYWSG